MADRQFHPHPEVILTELSDGSGVLLHLATKFFFTLNETGVVVWKALAHGATRADLCQALVAAFEVDSASAERDVHQLLADLFDERLVIEGD